MRPHTTVMPAPIPTTNNPDHRLTQGRCCDTTEPGSDVIPVPQPLLRELEFAEFVGFIRFITFGGSIRFLDDLGVHTRLVDDHPDRVASPEKAL